jgi:hypothetical protein
MPEVKRMARRSQEEGGMTGKSLTRPPRSKRPPEVIRQVDASMEAYRRVVEAARKDKPAAVEVESDRARRGARRP